MYLYLIVNVEGGSVLENGPHGPDLKIQVVRHEALGVEWYTIVQLAARTCTDSSLIRRLRQTITRLTGRLDHVQNGDHFVDRLDEDRFHRYLGDPRANC